MPIWYIYLFHLTTEYISPRLFWEVNSIRILQRESLDKTTWHPYKGTFIYIFSSKFQHCIWIQAFNVCVSYFFSFFFKGTLWNSTQKYLIHILTDVHLIHKFKFQELISVWNGPQSPWSNVRTRHRNPTQSSTGTCICRFRECKKLWYRAGQYAGPANAGNLNVSTLQAVIFPTNILWQKWMHVILNSINWPLNVVY